jgi:probable F420-dependent oxidoreductase
VFADGDRIQASRVVFVRFSISVPQFVADGQFDPVAFREYLVRAEELGFEGAWTQEQVLGSWSQLGAVEAMTFAAACTSRLRLGCAVFVTPLHVPAHLAKSLSSLDQLSRGRLEIGIGTGGTRRPFAAFGMDGQHLVTRFTEGLELMKALWTQDSVDFDGRFWQLSGAAMRPKPFQKPYPPIWFGGSAAAALRRAVRLGDGFFGAGSTTTATFAEQVRVVRAELAARGREDFQIAKRVYIAVDDDPARARERMSAALDDVYGGFGLRDLMAVTVVGTPADCVSGLREVADAGAEMILLSALFDQREQLERLAAEVLPAFG